MAINNVEDEYLKYLKILENEFGVIFKYVSKDYRNIFLEYMYSLEEEEKIAKMRVILSKLELDLL